MQRTHVVAIATVAIMVAGLAFALDEKQEYGNCVVVTDRHPRQPQVLLRSSFSRNMARSPMSQSRSVMSKTS